MDHVSPVQRTHASCHYQQKHNWDCGVSCVIMILTDPSERAKLLHNLLNVCLEEGFKNSTWTVDLCYLMKR